MDSSGDARNPRRPDSEHGFIFNELLFKQHAGFKRIQAQHALAKP
jgi:hypothetical protein